MNLFAPFVLQATHSADFTASFLAGGANFSLTEIPSPSQNTPVRTKVSAPTVPKLTRQQQARAARWHVKKMAGLLDAYGQNVLAAWIQLNQLLEMKRHLKTHLDEFDRMTKGKR